MSDAPFTTEDLPVIPATEVRAALEAELPTVEQLEEEAPDGFWVLPGGGFAPVTNYRNRFTGDSVAEEIEETEEEEDNGQDL